MKKMVVLNMCDSEIKKHWHAKGLERSEGRASYLQLLLQVPFMQFYWHYIVELYLLPFPSGTACINCIKNNFKRQNYTIFPIKIK